VLLQAGRPTPALKAALIKEKKLAFLIRQNSLLFQPHHGVNQPLSELSVGAAQVDE
jgi:hypothetical protein